MPDGAATSRLHARGRGRLGETRFAIGERPGDRSGARMIAVSVPVLFLLA